MPSSRVVVRRHTKGSFLKAFKACEALKKEQQRLQKKKSKKSLTRPTFYNINVPEAVINIPPIKRQIMYYRGSATLSADHSPNVCGNHVVALNDIEDPDQTGGGHRPLGYDQWNLYYNKYRVTSCVVKATFYSSASGNNVAAWCGIGMDKDLGLHAPASLDGQIEHQKGKYAKLLLPNSREKVVISAKYDAATFWKASGDYNLDEQTALFSAAPTDKAYLQLWMGSQSQLTSAIRVDFEIYFNVTMTEPKGISSS